MVGRDLLNEVNLDAQTTEFTPELTSKRRMSPDGRRRMLEGSAKGRAVMAKDPIDAARRKQRSRVANGNAIIPGVKGNNGVDPAIPRTLRRDRGQRWC